MTTVLEHLTQTINDRSVADPSTSYVAKLLHKGQDAILKKIGEEATELVMASKDNAAEKVIYECADLWFHSLVLLKHHNLSAQDVLQELARREGVSGIAEKASRVES